jgi:hypothetical protein
MNRSPAILGLATVLAAFAVALSSCSDVGDNSAAVPGMGDGNPEDVTSSEPADSTIGQTSEAAASDDSGGDSENHLDDATVSDDGGPDGTVDGAGTNDAAPGDTGAADTAAPDGSGQDASVPDSATVDAGVPDAGTADTGGPDAGARDAGTQDTGTQDTGTQDTGAPDTGAGLVPCTTVGQTGCVECQGNDMPPNATMTCTPTEAAVVQRDIDRGFAKAAGPDGSGSKAAATSCYSCLFQGGCLDDTFYGDTAKECEDPLAGGTSAQCLATLSCIFGSSCSSTAVNTCYCGTSILATTCKGNPAAGPINGACASEIAAGLGFSTTDGTDVTAHLTDTTLASGKSDQIFQCALSNQCAKCLQ